jgi:phosphoglycolate phosphatase
MLDVDRMRPYRASAPRAHGERTRRLGRGRAAGVAGGARTRRSSGDSTATQVVNLRHSIPARLASAGVLLLFDIDGTLLLRAHVEHRHALAEAVHEVWGADDPGPAAVPAAGRTDGEIAREICLLGGVAAERIDASADDFRAACARAYARLCPPDLRDRLAPHAPRVLQALSAHPGVRLSLVTGNLEAVARLKLERAGLGGFFARGQGAFGSDAEDRTELPAIARARAGGYPRADTVIIGDTPRDIACARADGVRCVAVATGPYSAAELDGADVVLESAHDLLDVL